MTRVARWCVVTSLSLLFGSGCRDDAPRSAPSIDADVDSGAAPPAITLSQDETERFYLSGRGIDDATPWELRFIAGEEPERVGTVQVPGHWEFQGYGRREADAPAERGIYRRRFEVPEGWAERRVWLVFEGAMSEARVAVNGQSAGPPHRSAFHPFRYDVTELLRAGENELEVIVDERSSAMGVEQASPWSLGGLYRPVYFEVLPREHIERVAIDAQPNGDLRVELGVTSLEGNGRLRARLFDRSASPVGSTVVVAIEPGQRALTLSAHFDDILPWVTELPTRYLLELELIVDGVTRHVVRERFGFRSVELSPERGLIVNGVPVRLRGLLRRGFWSDSGYATSPSRSVQDVELLKSMNANAVLVVDHTADEDFLEAADRLGLHVIDAVPALGAELDPGLAAALARERISTTVNHPSVVLWANAGALSNAELQLELERWDPAAPLVIRKGEAQAGLDTREHPSYAELVARLGGPSLVLPTAALSARYDSGGGAGLDDYWAAIESSAFGAGLFVSSFSDEVLASSDAGAAPLGEPLGVVDGLRRAEPSLYTLREIWSPVQIETRELTPEFDGRLEVDNRFDFLDLASVTFRYWLANFHFGPGTGFTVGYEGTARSARLAPGARGSLRLALPASFRDADALVLEAFDLTDRSIGRWSWMLKSPSVVGAAIVEPASPDEPADGADAAAPSGVSAQTEGSLVSVTAGATTYVFDATNGRLASVESEGVTFSFADGPVPASGAAELVELEAEPDGTSFVLRARFEGALERAVWRVHSSGWLSLSYEYALGGSHAYHGVSFSYPEALVERLQWLGRGPGRVWKNRMKGTWHDVWALERPSPEAATWDASPFSGYFADVYWARLYTSEGRVDIVLETPGVHLGLFTPPGAGDVARGGAPFPASGVSLLHALSPIGDGSLPASELGPQGAAHEVDPARTYGATVHFRFQPSGG